MLSAKDAREQNVKISNDLVNSDYETAKKMINGLINSGISMKENCSAVEIDLLKKETKIICSRVMVKLDGFYTDLGYKFETLTERCPNGRSTLTISWRE